MNISPKKNNRTGFIISVVVHMSLLLLIFFSKGCMEIQNPPQFTLEEVITIDFSDAGGGNPGSSQPLKPEVNEQPPAEKEITQKNLLLHPRPVMKTLKMKEVDTKQETKKVVKPKMILAIYLVKEVVITNPKWRRGRNRNWIGKRT